MKHRLLPILVIALCGVVPALAILGVGDIVFDPNNFEEALQQLAEMEQQYLQLVTTYQVIDSQYQEMLRMAQRVPVDMVARYRAVASTWIPFAAGNALGTTSSWTVGANTGSGVASGYSSAVQLLGNYGNAFARMSTAQQDHVKRDYATVELTDGANLTALQTIGTLRGNAAAVDAAIRNLENDSLSADPSMNTEIAVLNKINAAHMIALRNSQDTNRLLVSLAEERVIEAKRQRDAEAQAFNDHIQFLNQGQAVMAAQASGASSAMIAWRMP
jgi:hypothetical protein